MLIIFYRYLIANAVNESAIQVTLIKATLTGIRTATVINVEVATLAVYISAGELGEFIFGGIALNNGKYISPLTRLMNQQFKLISVLIQRLMRHLDRSRPIVALI